MSLFQFLHKSKSKTFAGLDGPDPSCPLGNARLFMGARKPWEVCADLGRQYGGMTLVWLLGKPAVVLNDAGLIGEVLDSNRQAYYKDAPHDALAPIITPEDMFISNGEQWRFMRENSPFGIEGFSEWLPSQFGPIRNVVTGHVNKLAASNASHDLIDAVRQMSYDAFSQAMWGKCFDVESFRRFIYLASVGSRRMMAPPVLQKLPPLSPFFYVTRNRWYDEFKQLVDTAQKNKSSDAKNLLQEVVRRGTKLSDTQLAMSLSAPVYFGGVFSMASAIVTTLYLLSQNADAAERVRAEIDQHVGTDKRFDAAALDECIELDYALREAMRLWTPVPVYFRNVSQNQSVKLGGHELPPDTLLFISNWLLHRDPKHYEAPLEFNPQRWANGGVERDPLGSSHFFPFGRGPRTCVGQEFAMFYMRLALATILSRADVKIDKSQKYEQGYFFAVMFPEKMLGRFVGRVPGGGADT